MRILAISGNMRLKSTNTCFLKNISYLTSELETNIQIDTFNSLSNIPIFSPDLEGENTPASVLDLYEQIRRSDGIIISSPECIRSIPGGLKNIIDWLVSRNEIIKKPIALAHASHRGDDVLQSLRLILSTISEILRKIYFLKFH